MTTLKQQLPEEIKKILTYGTSTCTITRTLFFEVQVTITCSSALGSGQEPCIKKVTFSLNTLKQPFVLVTAGTSLVTAKYTLQLPPAVDEYIACQF